MPITAVPRYLGDDFREASPGMRFGMYLPPVWNNPGAPKKKDPESEKRAWQIARKLEQADRDRLQALKKRQSALAAIITLNGQQLIVHAKSTAPFTTGLGNEHPLENGFAFLWPYGLPYLPGSGVKGVLRQAARELAGLTDPRWDIESDWNEAAITALFGSEDSNDAQRGALQFWDVIPDIKGDKLMVEVMTGHQSHYYMKNESPHDSGQPVPVNFLTVPPGSGFAFHVVCDLPFLKLKRIARDLASNDRWKPLLQQAFEHAFDWLGFGAKTAVGYGAMELDAQAAAEEEKAAQEQARARMPPEQRLLVDVRTTYEQEKAAGALQGGCRTAEQRVKLLNEAEGWESAELRAEAAELIETITQDLPWSKKAKKQGVPGRVAKLRG